MSKAILLHPQNDIVKPLLANCRLEAHPGLRFDRYLPIWDQRSKDDEYDRLGYKRADLYKPLRQFADDFNEQAAEPDGWLPKLLTQVHTRQKALAGITEVRFRVDWRFATGLGSDHPTDNGFLFDHVSGAPYIPGSAVKGLCRRAAELLGEAEPEEMRPLFGSEDTPARTHSEDSEKGEVTFFDAYPTRYPPTVAGKGTGGFLQVDIVNCHYRSYYQQQESSNKDARSALSETENPIPVFFLVIGSGVEFTFRFRSTQPQRIEEFLQTGLEWLGIGAKTAVGYGFMTRVDDQRSSSQQDSPTPNQYTAIRKRVESFDSSKMSEFGTVVEQLTKVDDKSLQADLTRKLYNRVNKKGQDRLREHETLARHLPQ